MIKLMINGKTHHVDVSPEMPILWVLRDVLAMTGTKYGCGKGLCGTCSVLLDGKSVRSCVLPVSAAQGKNIVTIEGVVKENKFLQKAWQEFNVPQCGYCQPGQLVSACALLKEKPNPTNNDIDAAMSGNICRCGTYLRIKKAIYRAVELSNE